MELQVEESVLAALPHLNLETVDRIKSLLLDDMGLSDLKQLEYVVADDLKEVLRPLQSRALINSWRQKAQDEQPVPVLVGRQPPVTPPPAMAPPASPPRARPPNASDVNWANNFQIPWSKFPRALTQAAKESKRPTPKDRREMVKILVGEMLKHHQNPLRNSCYNVAKKIVDAYPEAFADILGDVKVSTGCESLVNQIRCRVENVNRGNPICSRRTLSNREAVAEDTRENRGFKRKAADSYGCIRWQPGDLPEGETSTSVESKKAELKQLHDEGPQRWNLALDTVGQLMDMTYYYQRVDINSQPAPTVTDIASNWPFLTHTRWLFRHFEELVGINIDDIFAVAIQGKGRRLIRYMEHLGGSAKRDVQLCLKRIQDARAAAEDELQVEAAGVLMLLMAYYGESGLVYNADETSSPEDVEKEDLPDFPTIVALGRCVMTTSHFMLVVDRKVFCKDIRGVTSALAALFSIFYVLNIQYPETAGTTMEFIQRCFVGINPESGSKAARGPKGKKKQEIVNPRVLSLTRNLGDFEFMN